MDRKSRATLVENGMTVSPVSQAFRKEMDAIGNQLRGEWAKKAGRTPRRYWISMPGSPANEVILQK
jgi:hypothetical protein